MKFKIQDQERCPAGCTSRDCAPEDELPDFSVLGGGTVYLLQPNTSQAHDWIAEHISDEALRLGESIAVEHRFISDLIHGIRDDGLVIETDY